MKSVNFRSRILAHRGIWNSQPEQNHPVALRRALDDGFGIETDLRDFDGRLVISHDIGSSESPSVDSLIRLLAEIPSHDRGPVAINVKSDGLAPFLDAVGLTHAMSPGFYFDMSTPQLLQYLRKRMPVALRLSEYEASNDQLLKLLGGDRRVWIDGFHTDWWIGEPEISCLSTDTQLVVVSPEIHNRDPHACWMWFYEQLTHGSDVLLCTDLPYEVEKGYENFK